MTDDGWALPESLRGRAFTSREAAALGVGPRRLRGDRAQQLHHGVWADAAAELSLPDRARAALGTADELAWIGHATAATLHELALPPRLRKLDRIDVTVPSPMHAPRGSGIRGRQRTLELTAIDLLDGLRVASPAQAFVDGCDYLAFEDLVALGDSVAWERAPRATRAALGDAIEAHRGRRAHRRLVAAASSVRPRSGSRPETITRLQLEALGVPEPWCNVPVVLDEEEPIAPDVAFWQASLIIEVEGDQHRVDRKQWLTDLARYNRAQRSDIEVHRVVVTTPAETRRQLVPIVDRLRSRWDASRKPPPIAPFFQGPAIFGSEPWLFSA
ncbi:hypothetical protein [Agrococcus sp. DT81.2]|uniref:hypothetical protein n=1 Tax=Agrococcus sp. DT81.2 TaxID=3393414 RepID=UPI003CE58234